MVVQHYIYTRNRVRDYSDFIIPSCLNTDELSRVRKAVYPKLSEDRYDEYRGQWMMVTLPNSIVWGIICDNKSLSKSFHVDSMGREIRGFFSVVIKDANPQELRVPYDISYFKWLYGEEVESHWDAFETSYCKSDGFCLDRCHYVFPSSTDVISTWNDVEEVKLFHGESFCEDVARALTGYIPQQVPQGVQPENINVISEISMPEVIYQKDDSAQLKEEITRLLFQLKKRKLLIWAQWLLIIVLALLLWKSTTKRNTKEQEIDSSFAPHFLYPKQTSSDMYSADEETHIKGISIFHKISK